MASYDASNLIGMYTAGQDRRIAMEDRAMVMADREKKAQAEAERKALLRELFVGGGQSSSADPMPPASTLQQSYVGEPVPPPSSVNRPSKFILPKDATVMRKSLGDTGYEAWKKKNGLTEYDPAQEGAAPAAAGGPEMPAQDMPASSDAGPLKLNQRVLGQLMVVDPETGTQLVNAFSKMDEMQRKSVADKYAAMGSVAWYLRNKVPPEHRAAFLRQNARVLTDHGWTPQEIAQADLSDRGLDGYASSATDVKTLMQEARQSASDAATESYRDATIKLRNRALDLAGQRESRIAKWGPQAIIVGGGGGVRTDTRDLDY